MFAQGGQKMHCRTARGRIASLMVVLVGLLGAAQASAAVSPSSVSRPFSVRYAINTNGDIALAANTLMTCPALTVETQTQVKCEDAQTGSPGDDNYFPMDYVDSDGDPATNNSSSANLSMPAGATVLFAGLYWGAALDQGETLPLQCDVTARTGHPALNAAAAGSAWLKGPSGSYVPVNASVLDVYTEDIDCGNPAAPTSARATRRSRTSPRSCRPAAVAPTRSATSRPAPGPIATPAGRSWSPTRTSRSPRAT